MIEIDILIAIVLLFQRFNAVIIVKPFTIQILDVHIPHTSSSLHLLSAYWLR